MGMLRASCRNCGDIELKYHDVTVRICQDTNAAIYAFTCGDCGQPDAKPAVPKIAELLIIGGSELVIWRLPNEIHEVHTGGPLNHDDLLDFHVLLKGDDWMDDLVG